jgi:endonuclease G
MTYKYADNLSSASVLVIEPDMDKESRREIPDGSRSEVIKHKYYTIGYNETNEQADWVTYELTRQQLQIPNVPRSNWFEEDPNVSSHSAVHSDYSGSGYSRGHLAPAGDMAFSEEAMQASFFMSNMSPQKSAFNGGIWRELEECARDWTYKNERVWIATGPLFGKVTRYIGRSSQIRVPDAFYKIILDVEEPEKKGIAFIIKNEKSERPLSEYMTSIDKVEELTGLDFFKDLYENVQEEERIEGLYNMAEWPISEKRYKTRIEFWNNNN